jgi:hypothetical protein
MTRLDRIPSFSLLCPVLTLHDRPTPRDAQWQHLLPGINTFELPASNTQANNTGAMVNDASASGVGGSSNPQRVTSLTRSTFAASSRGSFLDEVAASVAHWNAQPMTLPTVVQGTAPIGEVTTVAPESILNPRVEAFVARGRPTTSFANPYSQNLGASMLMHSDYNDMYQAQQDSFIRGYDVQPYRLYGHGDQDTFYNNAYNSSMAPNSSGRETALIPYGHETSAVPYSYESAMVLRRQRPSAVNAMISGNELVVYDTDQAAVDAVAPDDRLLRHRAGRRCPDGVATCHFHHGVACHQEWSSCYFASKFLQAIFTQKRCKC